MPILPKLTFSFENTDDHKSTFLDCFDNTSRELMLVFTNYGITDWRSEKWTQFTYSRIDNQKGGFHTRLQIRTCVELMCSGIEIFQMIIPQIKNLIFTAD